MLRNLLSSFTSKWSRPSQASDSGSKKVAGRLASKRGGPSASKRGPSSGPALRRSNSLPARLPSQPHDPEQVKTVRKPITRPEPDELPPKDFMGEGDGLREGSSSKLEHMRQALRADVDFTTWLEPILRRSKDLMEFMKSVHPKFDKYIDEQKNKAYYDLGITHPMFTAETARKRNACYRVPNSATSKRLMEPDEQKFLSRAMQRIHDDVERKPFHRHGESAVMGNKNGDVLWFGHNPGSSISLPLRFDHQFILHNHRPFNEPFSSSASKQDHKAAAFSYRFENGATHYLTNGKDVLQIHPASMKLVKLAPDPFLEQFYGKFPVAFTLPSPQVPRPFSNHESPASFDFGWKPPEGWKPDPRYPRTEFFPKKKGEASGKRPQGSPPPSPRPAKAMRASEPS